MHNPIEKGYTLSIDQWLRNDEDNEQMKRVFYVSVIGSLIYAIKQKFYSLIGKLLLE